MHLSSTVLVALAVLAGSWAPSGAPQDVDVRAEFVKLHAAGDVEATRALWAAHRGRILITIDEDLEGSLSFWEAAGEAELSVTDMEVIAGQHERALWGAALATEVTGCAIYLDYTSSFVGWDDAQKRSFREGQAAFGRARQSMASSEWDVALAAGRECTGLEVLGRKPRALRCAEAAVALAEQVADADTVALFTARRDALK